MNEFESDKRIITGNDGVKYVVAKATPADIISSQTGIQVRQYPGIIAEATEEPARSPATHTGNRPQPSRPRPARFTDAIFNGMAAAVGGCARPNTPESLLGDGCVDPLHSVCDKSRSLPPWLSGSDDSILQRILDDYTQVGTVGQSRAVIETLYALGAFANRSIAGTLVGTDNVAAFAQTEQVHAGYRLDWGVELLNFAPFDLEVRTLGWVAAGYGLNPTASRVSATRNFTLRVTGNGGTVGGTIYIPAAVRVTPGMSIAQHVLAVPTDEDAVVPSVGVYGLPATVAAAFSLKVTLLTAMHPLTAAFAAANNLYGDAP